MHNESLDSVRTGVSVANRFLGSVAEELRNQEQLASRQEAQLRSLTSSLASPTRQEHNRSVRICMSRQTPASFRDIIERNALR